MAWVESATAPDLAPAGRWEPMDRPPELPQERAGGWEAMDHAPDLPGGPGPVHADPTPMEAPASFPPLRSRPVDVRGGLGQGGPGPGPNLARRYLPSPVAERVEQVGEMMENVPASAVGWADSAASALNWAVTQTLAGASGYLPMENPARDWGRETFNRPGVGVGWAARKTVNDPAWAADQLGQVAQGLKHYYWDEGVKPMVTQGRLGRSMIEDPVGFGLDLGAPVVGGLLAGGKLAKRALGWPKGIPTKSKLQQSLGTLSEAIGSEPYNIIQRSQANQALAAGRVATETAGYTLEPWVAKLADSIPYLRTNQHGVGRGLMGAAKLKEAVNSIPVVGEALARTLGLSKVELAKLSRLAEVIPSRPLDSDGFLRLGVKETRDNGSRYWRHGLDPEAAREQIAALSPQAQRLLMAYVEPADGFHLPPRLPGKGQEAGPGVVDMGSWALERLAEVNKSDPLTLAANFRLWGHNNFVKSFGMGGPENMRLAQLAAGHMEKHGTGLKPMDMPPESANLLGKSPAVKVAERSEDAAQLQPQEPPAGPGAGLREAVTKGRVGRGGKRIEAFVPGQDGSFELGRIGPEAAQILDMPEAPIRLQRWAEKHWADKPRRASEFQKAGYSSGREMVEDVARNFTEIRDGKDGSLLLVKRNGVSKVSYVKIRPSEEGLYYAIKSGHPCADTRSLDKRKLLWEARQQPPADFTPLPVTGASGPKQPIDNIQTSTGKNKIPAIDDPPWITAPKAPELPEWWEIEGGLPHDKRPKGQKPGTISREAAFADLVRHGVLQPRQHLQGYVTHMGLSPREAAQISRKAPELNLSPMTPALAKERLEGLSAAPPLDKAISAYRAAAEEAKLQRQMLQDLGPRLLSRVEPELKDIGGELVEVPGRPSPLELVRTVEEHSPWAGKRITRTEPLTLVDVNPEEAHALGLAPGRYTIPERFAERFKVLMGQVTTGQLDTPIEGFKEFLRDAFRYWKANVLVAPGTVATNLLGGMTQYGGKVLEDLGRGELRKVGQDLAAPFRALTPKAVEMLPKEVLGGNVATQFDRSTAVFFKKVQDRLKAGEPVRLPIRAAARLDQALGAGLNLALAPFGMVENFWKRSIILSELRTWAAREAAQMVKEGKAPKARQADLAQDLAAGAFQERPELWKGIMQGPVDAFAYDYDNIPIGLQKFRESTVGAATVPFPVYPYKYMRMLGRQAQAFNPFTSMPMKERLARGGSLAGMVAGPYALRRLLAGGDSEIQAGQDAFRELYPDTATDPPYPYLGGRDFIGTTVDDQGREQERFLRTAKYGYLNLPKALHSSEDFVQFLDEFKTTGPAVAIAANLGGFTPRQFGPRDLPGQIGELVSGFIPAHRVVEFTAQLSDDFRRRVPKGFWESIMVKFPGGREFIRQPMDKWARELARQDRTEEWLKFLSGINVKTVDKAGAKEALSEAVARAGERDVQDGQRLEVYARMSGLPMEALEPHLERIKEAETAAMLQYRDLEHLVFWKALLAGLDVMDPAASAEVTKLKRSVAGAAMQQKAGARNQAEARQAYRFAGGLKWIREHLAGEGGQ